jgi:hypothetical protein
VQLAEHLVEQGPQRRRMAVAVFAATRILRAGDGRAAAVNAQEWPMPVSRLFLVRRLVTVRDFPEVRVTGGRRRLATPGRRRTGCGRPPISASTIAPLISTRPGKLVMISWS